ncbi:MAG TPA: hypothetical protein VFW62_11920, partial [bacterium]|nr:hypothetical protein [bacterium]
KLIKQKVRQFNLFNFLKRSSEMAKMKKKTRKAGKHPGAITRKEQGQTGRPTNERRQNEVPGRHEEEKQQFGERFPRDTYEGGREKMKEF